MYINLFLHKPYQSYLTEQRLTKSLVTMQCKNQRKSNRETQRNSTQPRNLTSRRRSNLYKHTSHGIHRQIREYLQRVIYNMYKREDPHYLKRRTMIEKNCTKSQVCTRKKRSAIGIPTLDTRAAANRINHGEDDEGNPKRKESKTRKKENLPKYPKKDHPKDPTYSTLKAKNQTTSAQHPPYAPMKPCSPTPNAGRQTPNASINPSSNPVFM